MSESDEIKLWCWVLGDEPDRVFEVFIKRSATIDALKKAIQGRKPSFKDIAADSLNLVKFQLPLENFNEDCAQSIKLEDSQRLESWQQISFYWMEDPGQVLSVILPRPAGTSLKHPRSLEEEDGREAKRQKIATMSPSSSNESNRVADASRKHPLSSLAEDDDHEVMRKQVRKWTVNGAIRETDMVGCYYVNPGIQDESKHCLKAILDRQFVLLAGARASGKTTRLLWLQRELEAEGYEAIYLSFESIDCSNVQAFWNTFGFEIQAAMHAGPFISLSSQKDFLSFFLATAWKKEFVLVIDEFSDLYYASSIIREECLRTFRVIRNNNKRYAIRGLVAAGTFGIWHLTQTFTTSSFNIADHVRNPYFSKEETRTLFLQFAQDNLITIDNAVIEDVWVKSNGHPGMVCLCGRAISENLLNMLTFPTRVLSYKSWQTFSTIHLHDRAYEYVTFRTIIESLLREEAAPAVNLLRSHFLGFLDTVTLLDTQQEQQAKFLTAEGVLLQSARPHEYCMASAFVDGLIRRFLIPAKFPNAPSTSLPNASDGRLHVLEVLTQSLKFFDKDLIRLAADRSYKQSKVKVGGLRNAHVPRESVYDTELMRVLTNWLKQQAYAINGQWHLQTDQNKNKYCDIVISKPGTPTVILELLATEDASFIRAHIEKAPYYKDLLSADEAWVVHFTCEDDYLDHPTWQSNEQLQSKGINVVHFWHDQGFSTVSMSARWKDVDGNTQEFIKHDVAL